MLWLVEDRPTLQGRPESGQQRVGGLFIWSQGGHRTAELRGAVREDRAAAGAGAQGGWIVLSRIVGGNPHVRIQNMF